MYDHPQYAKRVDALYSRMQQRRDQLITSACTFGEVLAVAHRKGAQRAADESRRLLHRIVAEVIPFTTHSADHYAQMRGSLGFSPADSIHQACAADAGTDRFLTHDNRLKGKFVPGIQFIASLEVPFF